MTKCECGEKFVSELERTAGACAKCIPLLITMSGQRRDLVDKLALENEQLRNAYKDAVRTTEENNRLMEVERDGREAANRGIDSSECPYGSVNQDERVMWLSGWSNENTLIQLSRSVAVMTWALDALEVVGELIRSDVPEVVADGAAKMETVMIKVREFMEGLS